MLSITAGAQVKMPLPVVTLHSATKGAFLAITISLFKKPGARKVHSNSILPSATDNNGATRAGVSTGSDHEKIFITNTRKPIKIQVVAGKRLSFFQFVNCSRNFINLPVLFRGSEKHRPAFGAVSVRNSGMDCYCCPDLRHTGDRIEQSKTRLFRFCTHKPAAKRGCHARVIDFCRTTTATFPACCAGRPA